MSETRIPLDEVQEAYVALILASHAEEAAEADRQKALALRVADQKRDERFAVMRRALKIPDSATTINVRSRTPDAPAFVVFEAPDISPTVNVSEIPALLAATGTDSPQVSVKSTDAVQASGA